MTSLEVKEITDINEVLQFVPMEVELLKDEQGFMPLKDRLTWLDCTLNQKPYIIGYNFRIIAFYGDGELVGYFVAGITKSTIKYFNEIRVFRVWYDRKHEECVDKFWEITDQWAREFKVRTMRIEVNNPKLIKHFEEKYGFRTVSTALEKTL